MIELLKKNKEYCLLTLFFTLVALPIFIGFDGNSFYADAELCKSYRFPPLPISEFLIILLVFINFKRLLFNKKLLIAMLLATPVLYYSLFNNGQSRSVIIFLEAFNFLIALSVSDSIIPENIKPVTFYKALLLSLLIIFIFKTGSDLITDTHINTGCKTPVKRFIESNWFLSEGLKIYNYYDYFPLFYFFLFYVSYKNIENVNKFYKKALLLLAMIFSFYFIFITGSRIVLLLSILTIVLVLLTKIKWTNNLLIRHAFIIHLMFIPLYLIIQFYFANYITKNIDFSLGVRAYKIHSFFINIDFKSLFFPSIFIDNLETKFHNEYLSIYAWLGLPFFITFYYICLAKVQKLKKYDFQLYFIFLLIIFVGGCIQLNLLQMYSGNLVAFIIAGTSKILKNENE